jgi:hypothetical protein
MMGNQKTLPTLQELLWNRTEVGDDSDMSVKLLFSKRGKYKPMKNFLEEEQVNPSTLLALFENAFMKATLDEDKDIRVTTEHGMTILVEVLVAKKILKYASLFGFKNQANADVAKLEFLNTLNSKIILSRFSMPRADILLSEYFLPYEKGISSYQVINSFRLFERVTLAAIREYDKANLVE